MELGNRRFSRTLYHGASSGVEGGMPIAFTGSRGMFPVNFQKGLVQSILVGGRCDLAL